MNCIYPSNTNQNLLITQITFNYRLLYNTEFRQMIELEHLINNQIEANNLPNQNNSPSITLETNSNSVAEKKTFSNQIRLSVIENEINVNNSSPTASVQKMYATTNLSRKFSLPVFPYGTDFFFLLVCLPCLPAITIGKW